MNNPTPNQLEQKQVKHEVDTKYQCSCGYNTHYAKMMLEHLQESKNE